MDRIRTVVGSAGVEHPGHPSGCGEPAGGAGPQAAAETGERNRHLSRPQGTLLTMLW